VNSAQLQFMRYSRIDLIHYQTAILLLELVELLLTSLLELLSLLGNFALSNLGSTFRLLCRTLRLSCCSAG
jgi:hypothetical protein